MVTRWGFSDAVGRVALAENQEEIFLGHSVTRNQNVSEATSQKIDAEIRKLVESGHAMATRILKGKQKELEVLAKGLLEFETLTGEEIRELLAGKRPNRDASTPPSSSEPASSVPATGKTGGRRKGSGDMEPQPQV